MRLHISMSIMYGNSVTRTCIFTLSVDLNERAHHDNTLEYTCTVSIYTTSKKSMCILFVHVGT